MASLGRRSHRSNRDPLPFRFPRGPLAAIVGTAVVAVLAVVVVVLAFRVARSSDGPVRAGDVAELEARVGELDNRVTELRKTVRDLARQALASLDRAAKNGSSQAKAQVKLSRCLTQVQREIDDLQAYLAYGTRPRRNRVSGDCAKLLKPRFKG